MRFIRCVITALLFAGAASTLAAAESSGDLAIQARALLKKHCAECHDGQRGAPSSLMILDYSQLTDANRSLPAYVKPKGAQASQMLELIEDGSMPPGNRPKLTGAEIEVIRSWIDKGVPAYPRLFDDSYAYNAILADVEKLAEADRKSARYFTLHHLVDALPAGDSLAEARENFRQAVNSVAKKPLAALTAIDGGEALFRVDLRVIGWDTTPFRRIRQGKDGKEENLPTSDNIFDCLLLEYPSGVMPPREAEKLVEQWLRPIEMVRPIAFVHADWFAKAVDGTPLKNDLNRLLSLGAKARGMSVPEKKTTEPALSERPSIVIRQPAKAIPIIPIDAWYAGDYEPKGDLKLDISIKDEAGMVTTNFKAGKRLKMEIRASQTLFVEIILVDPEGSIFALDLALAGACRAGCPKRLTSTATKRGCC